MDGEEGRHEGAGPETAGHLPQDQEEENGAGGVQQDIGQMVSAGMIQPVELAVQHVREPSQRVPVGGMELRKGPCNSLRGETSGHVWIAVYVLVVVTIDELMAERLAEDQGHRQQEEAADGEDGPAAGRRRKKSIFRPRQHGTLGAKIGSVGGVRGFQGAAAVFLLSFTAHRVIQTVNAPAGASANGP